MTGRLFGGGPSEGPPRPRVPKGVHAALLLAAALAVAGPVQAQRTAPDPQPQHLLFWAVNAGIATVSGWIQGRPSRQPFHRALLGGLTGGTMLYAGQRIVGLGKPRLRILALETAAIGTSLTRNIALGAPPLSEVNLVFFPFYVRVRPHGESRISVRVSALGLATMIRTGTKYHTLPDLRMSLETGAPVFRVEGDLLECMSPDCSARAVGQHRFGEFAFAADGDACLCHETLHLIQDVRDAGLHGLPASDWALPQTGSFGRWLSRYLVVDGFLPLRLIGSTIPAERFDPDCRGLGSFYECEATALAHNR